MCLLIWLLAGCLLKKAGYLNVGDRLLRVLPVFFTLPLFYGVLQGLNEHTGQWGGLLFLHTAKILFISVILLVVWCIGILLCTIRYHLESKEIKRIRATLFECKTSTKGIFTRVCRKIGIPEKSVQLKMSYAVMSPVIIGVKHPVVVIPCEDYTEQELYAIFYHELFHYKHKDVLFRYILTAVTILNFFNPLVWVYKKVAINWSEFACDDCARKAYGDVKGYALALTLVAERTAKRQKTALGSSVDQEPMVRRIMNMLNYSKVKKKSKGVAALLVAAAILLAGTGSSIVAVAAADQYVNLYNSTVVQVEETTVYEPGVEYVDTSSLDGVTVEEGEVSGNSNARGSIISFSWSVSPGVLKKTPSLYCKSGQGIVVSCTFTPTSQDVRLGIIEPDGTRRFLQNSGSMSHTFALTKTGYYYVYVENISRSVTMTAVGSYCRAED